MLKKIFSGTVIAVVLATTAAPTAALAYDRGRHHSWHDHGYDHHRHDRYYGHGHRCKRDNGTGGLVIGAIAGGLLGHEVARDKTAGTIVGGGVGAIAGRAIDRSDRC